MPERKCLSLEDGVLEHAAALKREYEILGSAQVVRRILAMQKRTAVL